MVATFTPVTATPLAFTELHQICEFLLFLCCRVHLNRVVEWSRRPAHGALGFFESLYVSRNPAANQISLTIHQGGTYSRVQLVHGVLFFVMQSADVQPQRDRDS